jgi:hypothetical protein
MKRSIHWAGAIGVGLALAASGVAVGAAKISAAPKHATIKAVQKIKVKPNRWIQDGLRWDKDRYQVRSGGTLTILNNAASEGPHTFTVVKKGDLPKTAKEVVDCKICATLGAAHGADPNSDAPPKFAFLENGTGQDTPPDVDRPGDSGLTGPGEKGEKITLKVTAKKGSKLTFMCLIHPWMQARVDVVG